jgi:hypothetical protein
MKGFEYHLKPRSAGSCDLWISAWQKDQQGLPLRAIELHNLFLSPSKHMLLYTLPGLSQSLPNDLKHLLSVKPTLYLFYSVYPGLALQSHTCVLTGVRADYNSKEHNVNLMLQNTHGHTMP